MGKKIQPDMTKRHKQAGNHLVIQHGELKGTAVKIIDYIQNQFQGKSIKSLKERDDLAPLIDVLKNRKFEMSEQTVYACVPETPPRYILLDDSELQVEKKKPNLKVVHDPDLHSHGQEVNNDTRETGQGDNRTPSTEPAGADGRSIPSTGVADPSQGEATLKGQEDCAVGSGDGGSTPSNAQPVKREEGAGNKVQGRKGQPSKVQSGK